MYLTKLDRYYKDLCFCYSLCDKLAAGRGLATSEGRKFFFEGEEKVQLSWKL